MFKKNIPINIILLIFLLYFANVLSFNNNTKNLEITNGYDAKIGSRPYFVQFGTKYVKDKRPFSYRGFAGTLIAPN